MDSNNRSGSKALKRFATPLLLLIAGFILGGLHASTLNGHGSDAGFQGLAEAFVLFPAIIAVSLLVAAVGQSTRAGKYAGWTGVFFLAVEFGLLFGGFSH